MAMRTHSPCVLELRLLFVLFSLSQVSLCQDAERQQRHLELLGRTGNPELVGECSTENTSVILKCNLTSTEFVTDPGTNSSFVGVELRICLCASAWEIIYYYGDGSNVTKLCTQCPFQLHEGELSLYHNISVGYGVVDENGTNKTETVMGITVVLNTGESSRTVFDGTVPLSQQNDTCGNDSKGPPDPGDCPSQTTQPPTTDPTTGSPPMTTSSPSAGGIGGGGIAAIIVVLSAVAIVVGFVVFIIAYKCRQKQKGQIKHEHKDSSSPEENTRLTPNTNKNLLI